MNITRKSLFLFMVVLLGSFAFGETIGDQIGAISNALSEAKAKRPDYVTKEKALDAKKADIIFAYGAWKKQSAAHAKELAVYTQKYDVLKGQYGSLEPAAAAYRNAVNQHNAHQCVTTTDKASACAAYNAEKAQLDRQKSALEAQYAPLDAQASNLKAEGIQLDKNADLLDQIRDSVTRDTEAWTKATKQLINDHADNEVRIQQLEQQLAKLRQQYDACRGSIPTECKVRNVLNDKCENMHAVCGRVFDGNKP